MWKVGGKSTLGHTHEVTIREAVCLKTVERSHSVCPLLRQRLPFPADDLVAGTAVIRCTHLKAGGKDETIDFVLMAIDHNPFLGDTLDTPTLCVHQLDVGSVKRG